jgi:serine-type D-Ala-D-Ala carboxypeptidase (penicillin-binding protein 5/6)
VSAALVAGITLGPASAQSPSLTPSPEPTASETISPAPPSPEPPPPTTGPDGSPSPFPTALLTPEEGSEPPRLDVPSAILMDVRTGQILFAQGPDDQRPMASTTKIMTALLVAQRSDPEEPVVVSELAAAQPGSEAELRPGEAISVEELLYALLLSSANDAAVALAEHVSGDVEAFVDEMNQEAELLGLGRTLFASPTGLEDTGVSTARNLAALARRIYRMPQPSGGEVIEEVVRSMFHELPAVGGDVRVLQNRNVLLWLYPGAIGLKTGMTPGSGFSLVAVAEREGRRLVAVVMGGEDEVFSEAAALLNHGFEGFEERTLVDGGEIVDLDEVVSTDGGVSLPLVAARSLSRLVPVGGGHRITREIRCCDVPLAALNPGDPAGTLVIRLDRAVIGKVPLLVGEPPRTTPTPTAPAPGGTARADVWWPLVVTGLALAAIGSGLGLFRAIRRHSP